MSYEKSLRSNGYERSSYDSDKWINKSNNHWVKQHDGGSTTFSTSRHNTYGAGMSQNAFDDRLKK
jgi:hypothetical protein